MKGWQQPAERFPGMPRPPRKERSGAGIAVVPDKENTFEPQNKLSSPDNRKSTVEDYDEHNAERAPTIAPLLSPAERMAARLREARRRGIQGLVLVSSRDEDDIIPSSGLPPTKKEIEDDHQKLDEAIGDDVDPLPVDNDAAAKALSAADEELRKFFYPQMVSTDLPASSPIETAETFSSTNQTSPPLEEALTSDSASLEASIIVSPSNLLRIPDASYCDEGNDQEHQELRGGAAPSNDSEGFPVKVFSTAAEEVELLLNTVSIDPIVALSQVNSIDESTGFMKAAQSADVALSQFNSIDESTGIMKAAQSADVALSQVNSIDESTGIMKAAQSADVALSQVNSIDESTGVMKAAQSADTVKSHIDAGVEVAELPDVNGSDDTVLIINTSLSNCAKISTDQSSTNESTSEEEDDLEDQDTWSAGTPRNDTNCFSEVFSPLAEEVMHLIGAKMQVPALPEVDEIEEPNVILTILPSADGPIPLSGDQSSMHANEDSVKMAVLSDAAPAAPANHDLLRTEETDLQTASKSGGLCCFAGPVNMLVDDELAALIDATDDVAGHATTQAAPNSMVAPNVVEKKATSTLLAYPDSSNEKCAEEMEGVAQSPRSASTLDGRIVISAEDKVEATSALKEEKLEHDESNPKDITTSSTCEALELKSADTSINDQAQDMESLTSTEAATSALIGEPTSGPASEHGASTPNEITAARTSEPMELITIGNVIDVKVQDAESDAPTEAVASTLLEETTEKATEHRGPSPEDVTAILTSETTSTSAKLEMATAVTVTDEQRHLDAESAAMAEAATSSALGEDVGLEGAIELGEANRNENTTIPASESQQVAVAVSMITDRAHDAESERSALREERNPGKEIGHGAPAPKDTTTLSVSVPLDLSTTASVIDDQTEDVESDATESATSPSSLRGEVTMGPAGDSGELNPVSTSETLVLATAGAVIDQDVESDTSTEVATSSLTEEDVTLTPAIEHEGSKANNITTPPTDKTPEMAAAAAAMRRSARRRLRNLNLQRSRQSVTEGREENGYGN